MYFSRFFIVILMVISSFVYAEDHKTEKIETTEITKTPNLVPTSTIKPVVESLDSLKHKTTTHAPPKTILSEHETTHIKETTTKQPVSTTTIKPDVKNETVLPVMDNPKQAEKGVWILSKDNKTEIIFETKAVFHFQYNGTAKKLVDVYINLPKNATASMKLDKNLQTLSLDWSLEINKTNSFVLSFWKNDTVYELHSMSVNIYPTSKYFINYPGMNETISILSNGTIYETISMNMSYVCLSEFKPDMKSLPNNTMMYDVELSLVQFQAFIGKNSTDFNLAFECDLDGSEMVPIVIVIILSLLILTVLVFYIVNRRRTQARGYTSM